MKKQKYIVYGLINPKSHELFYVGMTGMLLRDRKTGHRCEARAKDDDKGRIIKSINYNFNICRLKTILGTKEEALKEEKKMIVFFIKNGHILCNSTIRAHQIIKHITNRVLSSRIINALAKGGFSLWEIMALMGYKSTNSVSILLK